VAFFTASTHPPLPLFRIREEAEMLGNKILPAVREIGLNAGINHLATLGHLDENPENSLNEPWQHLVDISGTESPSCYCAGDPRVQEYIDECYASLASAKPSFIWIDDDVRLESHPRAIRYACFCPFCLERFFHESGHLWTREDLHHAFNSGKRNERLDIRRQWQEHNGQYITRLLQNIRQAVDKVNPAIQLGLMTGETAYSTYGYDQRVAAMAGPNGVTVKWRPGGGFYTDDVPMAALDKAHSIGRQTASVPKSVTDVQYEHENFPYQILRKSKALFAGEILAAIGAGCTGVALNILNMYDAPSECAPYLSKTHVCKDFLSTTADTFGRSPSSGIYIPYTVNHFSAMKLDGTWEEAGAWSENFARYNELAEIGLPIAYSAEGAAVTLLTPENCFEYSVDELRTMLSSGVMMDALTLERLHEIGLGDLCGFRVCGRKDFDSIERFTSHHLNQKFAGYHRDCRPSFYPEPVYFIEQVERSAETISEVIDFSGITHGACGGVYENKLGGRVAVFGYYPWRMIQNTAKVSQLKEVVRWLSGDHLPAYVASYNRAAIWCRKDTDGHPTFLVLNASTDSADDITIAVAGDPKPLKALYMSGMESILASNTGTPGYAGYEVGHLDPWQAVLIRRF
ncbi:MAG: hypothetical protein ACYC0V_18340, partial [Armatimonadota bacterium]